MNMTIYNFSIGIPGFSVIYVCNQNPVNSDGCDYWICCDIWSYGVVIFAEDKVQMVTIDL